MPSPTRTPALFIGHGSPMNSLERNGYTEAWRAFGWHLPRRGLEVRTGRTRLLA